jgi:hypothetical protein
MGGWRRGHYTESLVYFSTLISSSLFHACNQDIYTGTAAYRSSHQLSSNILSLDCPCSLPTLVTLYTDEKEYQIFFIYKEIQSGAVAKSYTSKCANISPYMRRPLVIYDFATAPF